MTRHISIALDERLESFLTDQVEKGHYASKRDVVEAALGLLLERDARIAALRTAIVEAEESGPAVELNFQAFLDAKRGTFKGR